MDLLNGAVRPIYLKYLGAAFGSACISSIYGLVDLAAVGQYHGPSGTAAMSVVMPVFNIVYSLGLLLGIGGSVLYSAEKGGKGQGKEDQLFTAALLGTLLFSLAAWVGISVFETPLLRLFGAEDSLLPLVQNYLQWIELVAPAFLFNQMLAAFLRNDGDPGRATAAVLIGGIFNVFGDYFFVFVLDMGISGAGLATAMGSVLTLMVLLTHFLSPKNTLRLTPIPRFPAQLGAILTTGFSTFFVDLAMGIVTVLFNRQVLTYLGTDALAVYGVIMNISNFVQCCAYSVGQAAQPILSINFGAAKWDRIRRTLKLALGSSALFGVVWTALVLAVPNWFIRAFMAPTAAVLAIAPAIMRCYGLSFLLLPFNVFSTYYFQSIMQPGVSFVISVARGLVVSGGLILLLPALAGGGAVWLAMPITELVVAGYVAWQMKRLHLA